MRHRANLTRLSLLFIFYAPLAPAQTVWERAQTPALAREERIQLALDRTLAGSGDALDQMMARTAFVDLARGKRFERQAIVLLLVRLRRQLGLEPERRTLTLLQGALSPDQPRSIRALGALEAAHALLSWQRSEEAEGALDQALQIAWSAELRSEILLLRGWVRAGAGRLFEAELDFEQILGMDVSRRRLAVTLMSLSCVREELGDRELAQTLYARGQAVERSRAQASGASLFSGEGLHPAFIARLEQLSARLAGERIQDTEETGSAPDGQQTQPSAH